MTTTEIWILGSVVATAIFAWIMKTRSLKKWEKERKERELKFKQQEAYLAGRPTPTRYVPSDEFKPRDYRPSGSRSGSGSSSYSSSSSSDDDYRRPSSNDDYGSSSWPSSYGSSDDSSSSGSNSSDSSSSDFGGGDFGGGGGGSDY